MTQQRYPSDLTDDQWQRIESLIPPASRGGRPRELDMREVVNAIRYLLHARCSWRELPADFPHGSSVRHYYSRWRLDGTWDRLAAVAGLPRADPS